MIWSIQALRFFAALMIVYIHAANTAIRVTGSNGFIPRGLATVGVSGVDIFFVISGVIIAKIAPGKTPAEFIWSRFIRIVPMYLIFTVPDVATAIGITGFGWRDALATYLLWPATDRMTLPTLGVGWTLCFEMLFYAAAALVLVERRWAFVIFGAYGIALLFRPIGPIFQFLGNPIILEFLLGVAISFAPSWRPGIWGIPIGAFLLAGAGLIGIAPAVGTMDLLQGPNGLQRVLIFGIPSALIVYGTLQVQARESVWTYLGYASYSLYLSHVFPLAVLLALCMKFSIPPDLIIVTGISAAVLFAWRIHERIEKPIMAALKREQGVRGAPIEPRNSRRQKANI
jgi:exopolysaccharide production protein ExoZ